MILLSMHVMEEINRYLNYGWEWKTICKVINFKHGYDFEIFEIEELFYQNLGKYREYKKQTEQGDGFKSLWLGNK